MPSERKTLFSFDSDVDDEQTEQAGKPGTPEGSNEPEENNEGTEPTKSTEPTEPTAPVRPDKPEEHDSATRLDDIYKAFIEDCAVRNLAEATMRTYTTYLRVYLRFCQRRGIDPIMVGDEELLAYLRYYKEERSATYRSVANAFVVLSSFYEYLQFTRRTTSNPIPPIRKRYLQTYKGEADVTEKNIPSVKEMAHLISIVTDIRDRAILVLFAKTGIRRMELMTLDIDDLDLENKRVTLKPTAKRSNRIVFFDEECKGFLEDWLFVRTAIDPQTKALFSGGKGLRIKKDDLNNTVTGWAEKAGFHDPWSKKSSERFTPHCFRHWFTTHLIRNGMPRDYVKELRGDARREAIDLYNHIDKEDLKRVYLKNIPKLFPIERDDKEG